MTPSDIIDWAVMVAEIILAIALVATTVRIILGPTLADRVLGLDMLVAIAIGFIALVAMHSHFPHALDIAMALSIAGFLATLAFARYILTRGRNAGPARKDQQRPEKKTGSKGRKRS